MTKNLPGKKFFFILPLQPSWFPLLFVAVQSHVLVLPQHGGSVEKRHRLRKNLQLFRGSNCYRTTTTVVGCHGELVENVSQSLDGLDGIEIDRPDRHPCPCRTLITSSTCSKCTVRVHTSYVRVHTSYVRVYSKFLVDNKRDTSYGKTATNVFVMEGSVPGHKPEKYIPILSTDSPQRKTRFDGSMLWTMVDDESEHFCKGHMRTHPLQMVNWAIFPQNSMAIGATAAVTASNYR